MPRPRDGAVRARGRGEAAGGIADDLEIPDHRVLDKPFPQERLAAARDVDFDRGNGVGDPRAKPEDKHVPGRADRFSQGDGIRLDIGPEVGTEAAGQHEIDFSVQQGFDFLGEGEVVAEAAILRKVDQQIDIAVRTLLAAGDGAEQAEVRRTVPRGDLVQRVVAVAEVIA